MQTGDIFVFFLLLSPKLVYGIANGRKDRAEGTLLTDQLWRIWLPYSSNSQETVSLTTLFARPKLTALFWGPWTAWPTCSPSEGCRLESETGTELLSSSRRVVQRTRVCQRHQFIQNSKTRQFYWHEVVEQLIPCHKEMLLQRQQKSCPHSFKCDQITTVSPNQNVSGKIENPTASQTSNSQSTILQTTTTHLNQTDVSQYDSTKTSKTEQASVTWKTLQPCRPLIPEIDHLQAGFAWEWLLRSTNRLIGQRCEPGIELQVMQCTQTLDNQVCPTNQQTRQVHCWINERCANGVSKLEPPAGCVFTTTLNELFLRISWYRTPYGTMPVGYQIQLMALKPTMKHQHIVPDVRNISMGSVDPWGERYVIEWTGLVLGWAYEVSVGSIGADGTVNFGDRCMTTIIIGAGDGAWSAWSEWSACSTKCASVLGSRVRTRQCDSPEPANNGRFCPGPSSMLIECFGDNIHC
ncbi:hypothetical protein EG68_00330 [Paragonimus skrjabini miyazakii]|uniref:Uncharacterized protein n=1 Tax=Paragonimus skrjabini miyazakii TaxID=59628 RepID=A0A8S9Z647_9TREM|nr:hypothetical protein EG68_00330 [Paragonimus skrjabini miyazakii]